MSVNRHRHCFLIYSASVCIRGIVAMFVVISGSARNDRSTQRAITRSIVILATAVGVRHVLIKFITEIFSNDFCGECPATAAQSARRASSKEAAVLPMKLPGLLCLPAVRTADRAGDCLPIRISGIRNILPQGEHNYVIHNDSLSSWMVPTISWLSSSPKRP